MAMSGWYCIHSTLVGAMNPCPCGFYGDPFRQRTCSPSLVSRYQKRISGPFIDRVDIFVEVPHIDYEKLARTIADLENADIIKAHHLAEAIQYRPRRML